jgi:hypothetical protein
MIVRGSETGAACEKSLKTEAAQVRRSMEVLFMDLSSDCLPDALWGGRSLHRECRSREMLSCSSKNLQGKGNGL